MSGKQFLRTGERTWVDIGSITHVVGTHAAAGEPDLATSPEAEHTEAPF